MWWKNKPDNNIRFWSLIAVLLLLMSISLTSCSSQKTAMNCPSYGMSWDRTQNY